ncbi:MAG: hypothetical protein A2Z47_05255 [Thermodesulfovibrio sp. RBG_19FT_COMBO_42_12]|jgi:hypothetical protein|nr:MAG: hypothetical protein A2Z47_05255 [Thermodesulfovibrio sp. RBG_19FT_COMBO_42_12]
MGNKLVLENKKVSIIILVHNAPKYVIKTLSSLKKTKNIVYETIVIDNKSRFFTKFILFSYFIFKRINRLLFIDENTLFSKGNNIGSKIISNDSTYILLLNSDVKINNPYWLEILLQHHETGSISFGVAHGNGLPQRADGFCFLIDKEIYIKYQLDEYYEHTWSITKLQAELLKAGYCVKAIRNYSEYITHFGKKSGKIKQKRKASIEAVATWFNNNEVKIIDKI